jgi:hypothetical protein
MEVDQVGGGRPREFDTEKARELAMALLGRNGYEGNSLSERTNRLGMTPPSLRRLDSGNDPSIEDLIVVRDGTGPRRDKQRARITTHCGLHASGLDPTRRCN